MKKSLLVFLMTILASASHAEELNILLGGTSYDDLRFTFVDLAGKQTRAEVKNAFTIGFTGRAPIGIDPLLFAAGADISLRTSHITAVARDYTVRTRLKSDFIQTNVFAGLGTEYRTDKFLLGIDGGLLLSGAWHEARTVSGTRTTDNDSAMGYGTRIQAGIAIMIPQDIWLGLMARNDTLRMDFDITPGHKTTSNRALFLTCMVEF